MAMKKMTDAEKAKFKKTNLDKTAKAPKNPMGLKQMNFDKTAKSKKK